MYIEIKTDRNVGGNFKFSGWIIGHTNYPLEVISVSNIVNDKKLSIGTSVCLSSDIEVAKLMIECMALTIERAEKALKSQVIS